ncbi:MAG: hypothetical protein AAB116_03375, partial [Candidatus Poribacteria bacterium]
IYHYPLRPGTKRPPDIFNQHAIDSLVTADDETIMNKILALFCISYMDPFTMKFNIGLEIMRGKTKH